MNRSLNSIMNEMARRQNMVRPADATSANLDRLSELEAFAVLDEILDALHKQYLDAKAQRKELVALSGADDAMAVVAVDMEDSAWCAMQTRYIELRTQRKMMARAQQMMRARERLIEEREERIAQSDKAKQAHDFANYLEILRVVKEKNRIPQVFEWLILFLIFRVDLLGRPLDKKPYALTAAVA